MKLFNRKRRERQVHPILVKFLFGINQRLRKVADYLQKRSGNYSARTQKIVLVAFCLTFITISVYVAADGIRNRPRNTYTVKAIKAVQLVEEKTIQPQISVRELSRIHQFKNYLERLSKRARDSLLLSRPHLMDTLNFLETLYQNQIKTK
jgi:hypothetical protein